jgi:hypothetical protein
MIPNTKVQNGLGMLSCMEDHKVWIGCTVRPCIYSVKGVRRMFTNKER